MGETVVALATVIALVGTMPHIALQFKAVFSASAIITHPLSATDSWIAPHKGPVLVALMVVFTIFVGSRRLDPTERHPGMIMISSITVATMMTDHLLLPVVGWIEGLAFPRRQLLKCRRVAVAGVIMIGYRFD